MNNQTHFICIDGPDFSGKTTLIEKLKQHYIEKGFDVHTYRQPGSTAAGEKIRDILLSNPLPAIAQAMLFVASRIDFVEKVIKPLKNNNVSKPTIVFTDRWYYSTLVYNLTSQQDRTIYQNNIYPLEYKPDLSLILNVDLNTIKQRKNSRLEQINHFDVAEDEIVQKRVEEYVSLGCITRYNTVDTILFKNEFSIIRHIPANGSPDQTFEIALFVIENYFN